MSEPITRFVTPIHLVYEVGAGRAQSAFLRGMMEHRLLGQRCSGCHKVYVPPRGCCPTCGITTEDEVEVAHDGTVTTFCVVNIPFEGQLIDPPYICAAVLLDGADTPLFHLVGGCPVDEVRMGSRVRAVWVDDDAMAPTLESIRYFEPNGEPDAPFESYREHL